MKTEEFDLIAIDKDYWIKYSIGVGIPCGETTKVLTLLDTKKSIIIAWRPLNNAEFLELLEAYEKQHPLFNLTREELLHITVTKSMKAGDPAMNLLRLRHAIQSLKQD